MIHRFARRLEFSRLNRYEPIDDNEGDGIQLQRHLFLQHIDFNTVIFPHTACDAEFMNYSVDERYRYVHHEYDAEMVVIDQMFTSENGDCVTMQLYGYGPVAVGLMKVYF